MRFSDDRSSVCRLPARNFDTKIEYPVSEADLVDPGDSQQSRRVVFLQVSRFLHLDAEYSIQSVYSRYQCFHADRHKLFHIPDYVVCDRRIPG